MKKVWLITGCSTGIGLILAQEVLRSCPQAQVIATARQPNSIEPLFEEVDSNRLLITRLDVTIREQIQQTVNAAIQKFGGIDILVNNAGYGLEGALEELTEEEIRLQMETNFFGLVFLTQACIPIMRQQKSGYIINISSVAGLRGFRGMSMYCASKFAVVGLSEALSQELAPFGIRVSVIEPGPYRTDWAGRSLQKSRAIREQDTQSPYYELNMLLEQQISGNSGKQPGDPLQIAKVLIAAAQSDTSPPLHMVFGDEGIAYWKDKLRRFSEPNFWQEFPHTRWSL
ncbi:MAG: SDR family NAD(P)-dependent oxidoreductase [Bacteroidia bacterium]|nr:SDR family NAD(P)-dependent oxidoreductase [Bacteroidia bacterium]MDW8157532.1 SDR family NAD(P)-dependent oxidoreductase [Bacteroidia bacterium]